MAAIEKRALSPGGGNASSCPNRSFVEPDQTRSFYLTAFRAHDRMGYRGDTQHQNGMDRDIGKPFKTAAVVESAGRIAVGPHREAGADRPPDVVI